MLDTRTLHRHSFVSCAFVGKDVVYRDMTGHGGTKYLAPKKRERLRNALDLGYLVYNRTEWDIDFCYQIFCEARDAPCIRVSGQTCGFVECGWYNGAKFSQNALDTINERLLAQSGLRERSYATQSIVTAYFTNKDDATDFAAFLWTLRNEQVSFALVAPEENML